MPVVMAIDAGTTGVRSLAVSETGEVVGLAYRELTQHFPAPGLVEHDAAEIWRLVEETLAELAGELHGRGETVAAVGITNQRETAVAFDRHTGRPLQPAIVWQDRRTARRCEELVEAGHLPLVRNRTGLVLDSYFSATKWEWMLRRGGLERAPGLALATVDDWLCWKLTGGTGGGLHATDPSNASRTLCYDIVARRWSDELCELFGVPSGALGEIRPSSGRFGLISPEVAGGRLAGVALSGIAGDQQAALFGQGCHSVGSTKVTYGTGSFILMNLAGSVPAPVDGLLTTVAWQLEDRFDYALEGAVFSSGATIQWLRDGLRIIEAASEVEALASSVPGTDGVHLVPAFSGMGSPWWDPHARGTVTGISRGTTRAHLARAAVEAMAFQTRDVLDAMRAAAGREITELRCDGGASVMDLLLQLQADQGQVRVSRSPTTEVTALGAAFLAGLAEGVWGSLEELKELVPPAATFEPNVTGASADRRHDAWLAALARAGGWEAAPAGSAALEA